MSVLTHTSAPYATRTPPGTARRANGTLPASLVSKPTPTATSPLLQSVTLALGETAWQTLSKGILGATSWARLQMNRRPQRQLMLSQPRTFSMAAPQDGHSRKLNLLAARMKSWRA
eukprot:144354-Prymnesium_polylepis.1